MRFIDLIVIHCSATPNGKWVTVEDIDAWHARRGFHRSPAAIGNNQPNLKAIGYHFVIYTTGAVVMGRGLDEIGAHAKGHNLNSIGVCMVGTDKFSVAQWETLAAHLRTTAAQLAAARRLPPPSSQASVEETLAFYHRLGVRICGHRDLSPDLNGDGVIEPREWTKTCPGFDVSAWLASGMTPPPEHLLQPGEHP